MSLLVIVIVVAEVVASLVAFIIALLLARFDLTDPKGTGPPMSDELNYDELDPGIRRTVRWLRSLGYDACDSGDGKTKLEAGWSPNDARNHPHVVMRVHPDLLAEAADALRADVHAIGATVLSIGQGMGVWIQASYDPAGGAVAVLDIMGLDDSMLPPGVGES